MAFVQRFVTVTGLVWASFILGVSSQCDRMKSCPGGGLCVENGCKTEAAESATIGVEILVAIMSVSVVLIIGLVVLLVYVCLKKGPGMNEYNESHTQSSCPSSAVEIVPERRRFSSMTITSGPPPYFSLFDVIIREGTTVIGSSAEREQNSNAPSGVHNDNGVPRILSFDVELPAYHALFGQSPPQYDDVVFYQTALEHTNHPALQSCTD